MSEENKIIPPYQEGETQTKKISLNGVDYTLEITYKSNVDCMIADYKISSGDYTIKRTNLTKDEADKLLEDLKVKGITATIFYGSICPYGLDGNYIHFLKSYSVGVVERTLPPNLSSDVLFNSLKLEEMSDHPAQLLII